MAKVDVMSILYSKEKSPLEFNFDMLTAPSMYNFITQYDIEKLRNIATSIRYSGKMEKKMKEIDMIMKARDCKKVASGTNRIVYRPLEYQGIVFKMAIDKVGMKDNPSEMANQHLVKPFVTKVFETSPCGTVGSMERVEPVINRKEFASIAYDIYDLLVNNIIGEYVIEDIGTEYFMNFGIRRGFGPVILDFPYIYPLDGKKLFCNSVDPMTGIACNGEIDYDNGFNKLLCTKCGKRYYAKDLQDHRKNNTIKLMRKGERSGMKVQLVCGNEVVKNADTGTDIIKTPTRENVRSYRNETIERVGNTSMGNIILASQPKKGRNGKNDKRNRNNNQKGQHKQATGGNKAKEKKPWKPPVAKKIDPPVEEKKKKKEWNDPALTEVNREDLPTDAVERLDEAVASNPEAQPIGTAKPEDTVVTAIGTAKPDDVTIAELNENTIPEEGIEVDLTSEEGKDIVSEMMIAAIEQSGGIQDTETSDSDEESTDADDASETDTTETTDNDSVAEAEEIPSYEVSADDPNFNIQPDGEDNIFAKFGIDESDFDEDSDEDEEKQFDSEDTIEEKYGHLHEGDPTYEKFHKNR